MPRLCQVVAHSVGVCRGPRGPARKRRWPVPSSRRDPLRALGQTDSELDLQNRCQDSVCPETSQGQGLTAQPDTAGKIFLGHRVGKHVEERFERIRHPRVGADIVSGSPRVNPSPAFRATKHEDVHTSSLRISKSTGMVVEKSREVVMLRGASWFRGQETERDPNNTDLQTVVLSDLPVETVPHLAPHFLRKYPLRRLACLLAQRSMLLEECLRALRQSPAPRLTAHLDGHTP